MRLSREFSICDHEIKVIEAHMSMEEILGQINLSVKCGYMIVMLSHLQPLHSELKVVHLP